MKRLGYRASLDWLLDNDDTEWLDDEFGSFSVTLALLADIFGVTIERAVCDLRARRNRRAAA